MKSTNATCKVNNEKSKILTFAICILQFALIVSGCAGFQAAGDIQQGRMQLIFGDPKVALVHFQRAAEVNPDFLYYSVLPQGIWTYVGRASYLTGKLPEARQAFERALSRYDQDYLARLYLGLILARDGERQRGLKEIESGIRGLYDWLEYINFNTFYGQFWDPRREIRSELQSDLAMISGKEIDWQQLITSGEWVGKRMEEEIDLATRDERLDRLRDSDSKQP